MRSTSTPAWVGRALTTSAGPTEPKSLPCALARAGIDDRPRLDRGLLGLGRREVLRVLQVARAPHRGGLAGPRRRTRRAPSRSAGGSSARSRPSRRRCRRGDRRRRCRVRRRTFITPPPRPGVRGGPSGSLEAAPSASAASPRRGAGRRSTTLVAGGPVGWTVLRGRAASAPRRRLAPRPRPSRSRPRPPPRRSVTVRCVYGRSASSRAVLIASAMSRWCCSQLPDTRRARILPRSDM